MQTTSFHGVGFSPHDPDLWHPTGQSLGVRETQLRSRFSTCGFLVEPDLAGRDRVLNIESRLEKFGAEVFSANPAVKLVIEQPVTVEYTDDDGTIRHHTFDLLTVGVDGVRTLIAEKTSARVESSGIERTVKLIASQIGRDIADRILVVTNRHFSRAERANAELIHETRRHPFPEHDAAVRAVAAEIVGDVTIRDLIAATGLPTAAGFRAVVREIDGGSLRLAKTDARIDHGTHVRRN